MTTAIVVITGAGILLVISAIENSSIVATFLAVWNNQPLSSLGPTGQSGSSGSSSGPTKRNPKPAGPIAIQLPKFLPLGNTGTTGSVNPL